MSNWIDVKEVLPKERVEVLTWQPKLAERYGGTAAYGLYHIVLDKAGWPWWSGEYQILVRDGLITHWIPLPEAPKSNGEG